MTRIRWRSTILLAVLTSVNVVNLCLAQTPANFPPNDPPPRRNGTRGPARSVEDSPIAQVGRAIFFDKNISNPPGMACASCHAQETGFSNPNSYINDKYGSVPGVVQNRFGSRKPMTISYAWFAPEGPTFWRRRQGAWEGGYFSDGRAKTLEDQASVPMLNPNEMDNAVHGLASSDLVVRKVVGGSYSNLFQQAFGDDALSKPSADVFRMIREAIAAYEKSRDVSPFSSKYDAYVEGQTQLTQAEENGLHLFTGSVTGRPGGAANYKSAQCVSCHTVSETTNGRRDFFTNWTYANVGVPKNPRNPYYSQTKAALDPKGYNADGDRFVDLGLGAVLYPEKGLPPGNIGTGSDGRGDFLQANGEFRVPSLRNVDKRPDPEFVKCYMHNGVFRSLKEVVHFYNTRNLTSRGEILNLVSDHSDANLRGHSLWPAPEYASAITLQNAAGRPNSSTARVGNLLLTEEEEDDIVAFLGTLNDGYFAPARRPPRPD